jgi:hypothetical protein
VLKVGFGHGSRDATCLGQFAVGSISEHSAGLATVPPLLQRLVIAELSQARPLRSTDTKRPSRGVLTTKLRGESFANLIEMHEFVNGRIATA